MRAIAHHVRALRDRYIYILLVAVAVIGLMIGPSYGMGWDEPTSDHAGKVTLAYLQNREDPDNPLSVDFMHFYGVVFELPLAFIEESLHLNTHDTFVFRHIATFFLFLIGIYVFYLLCRKRFPNSWLPLIGTLFLLASPIFFAHAFFNSKDIPTLVFFIIAIYTLVRLLEAPNIKNICIHALMCALLIDVRIPGLFVVVITVAFLMLHIVFFKEYRLLWKKMIGLILLYGVLVSLLVVVFWPYLWADPLPNFLAALADMSHFSRQANLHLLYQGKIYIASQLPWHYIPVWISITTPIMYLILFCGGVAVTVLRFFKTFFTDNSLPTYYRAWTNDLVVCAWFFGPIFAVIVLHSIMYDGWRQMYFVYPALIYIALIGSESLYLLFTKIDTKFKTFARLSFIVVVLLTFISTVSFMIRSHPYQNVYFNAFVGGVSGALRTYEVDYWGLTFRKGLEYIASHDPQEVIPVLIAGGTQDNLMILTKDLQKRFKMISTEADLSTVKYVLTNYRWQDYDSMPWDTEYYALVVDGAKIMTIFKNP